VPIANIRSAEVVVERTRNTQRVGVRLVLEDSDVVALPLGTSWDASRAQALVERIKEVVADARRDPGEESTSAVAIEGVRARLGRMTRTTGEWLNALRALGAGVVATHRVAPVAPETFLRVVEDSTAKPTERAAAAIALMSSDDEGMRTRVRIASETVVEPKLRVALATALAEDDEALFAAVEALEALERKDE
jgi:hypothetical protein